MGKMSESMAETQRLMRKVLVHEYWLEVVTIENDTTYLDKHIAEYGEPFKRREWELKSDYIVSENQGIKKIERSFATLNLLLVSNFFWFEWEMQITLNYSEPVFDDRQVDKDIEAFWRMIHRQDPELQYLAVKIPDSTGAWRCRMLLKGRPLQYVFIDRDILEGFWGNGPVDTYHLFGEAKVALEFYAMRYDKKLLARYPDSCRLYHCSRGITLPQKGCISRQHIESTVSDGDFWFDGETTYCIDIKDEKASTIETIAVCYEVYFRVDP